MKRRELLSRAFLFTVSSIVGGSYLNAQDSNHIENSIISRLYPYHPSEKVYLLPNNPIIYETFNTVSVANRDLPLKVVSPGEFINISSKELIIIKEGSYEFQYMGPSYGWRVS